MFIILVIFYLLAKFKQIGKQRNHIKEVSIPISTPENYSYIQIQLFKAIYILYESNNILFIITKFSVNSRVGINIITNVLVFMSSCVMLMNTINLLPR